MPVASKRTTTVGSATLPSLLLSALLLGGCVTTGGRTGIPSLGVAVPGDCNRLLVPVRVRPAQPQDDARLAYLREHSARLANAGRIVAGRKCWDRVRAYYGGR